MNILNRFRHSPLLLTFTVTVLSLFSARAYAELPAVFRDHVEPHWYSQNTQFWYRNDLRHGAREFVVIDAMNGRKMPAFDHARAAVSLSAVTGAAINFDRLPVDSIDLESIPGSVVLTGATHVWRMNLTDYEIKATPPPTAPPSSKTSMRQNRRGRKSGIGSPDGKWSVSIASDNLVLESQGGGDALPLSDDGKPGDAYSLNQLWWSPDSQYLVALRVEAAQEHTIYTVESSPKDQLQPKLRTLNYLKAGDKIAHPRPKLFHIASRKPIPINDDLFANPWTLDDVRWTADSSHFTFAYNQRGHQVLRVLAVDPGNGAVRTIVDEHYNTFIDYSGKYFCDWINDNELVWMSERDGWNHLFLVDTMKGTLKNLTPGNYVVQSVIKVDAGKRQVWFRTGGIVVGQDPYYSQICRVNFDGSDLTMLTDGDGTHSVQWSPDEKYLLDTWSRIDLPPETDLRNAETGKLVCKLEVADAQDLFADKHQGPQRFSAKGRDGATDIYGMILYPRDYDPAHQYPVVEYIYAGTHGFFTPKSFRARYGHMQQVADQGIIVVQCDGMGTSGRSKAFHDVCWKNLKDAGFADRIAWIKSAAATVTSMDLTRVGIYGGSAGGQNAMAALLWHNDFYSVAVADCGCHDNRMDKIWWNEQWMGWPVGPEYAASSNAVNAHLLGGKLLLIFGELDNNVDPSSTLQVVNALEQADKRFDLVIVTGAKHGAAETPYGSKRRLDFLTEHLLR